MDPALPPGIPGATQPKTSSQAVWSLVLGILSNTCLWLLGSIPAIILGVLALKNIDRAPGQLGGRGLAIAGIITGASGVLIGMTMLAIVASIITPAFTTMNRSAKLSKQTSDVRQLILACRAYAADEGGQFPPNLEILAEEGYLENGELLTTFDFETREPVPYQDRTGATDTGAPTPVIIGPATFRGKRVVGFTDGTVTVMGEAEFEGTIGSESLDQ